MSVTVSGVEPDVEDPEIEIAPVIVEPNDEQLAKQQAIIELKYARSELLNLMAEAKRKGVISKIKAEACRIINVSLLIFLAICSGATFIVSAIAPTQENLPIIIVSAVTTVTTVIYGIIGPGARGSYYNQISVRLSGMFRTARESFVKLNNSDEMLELVNLNMNEMDQMDLNIYSLGNGNGNGK